MKLSTAVIAALAAVNVDAKKTLDAKTLRKTINKAATKQSLLRKARKLDQQEDGDFQITSDYFIKFNSCASLKLLDVDDVSTYITNSQYSGSNVDLDSLNVFKDYIVFDATSASSGQTVQYVIDVATYVDTLVQAIPSDYEAYCETCEDAYETCAASSVSTAGADEGGRKLTYNYEQVDCDLCYANGCFYEAENEGEDAGSVYTDSYGYTSTDALEWLSGVSECQEISQDNGYTNFNGYYTLYAGLTCNAAGTGVEIGLFANDECTVQSTQTSFSNIISSETQINSYFELTKSLVEHSFTQTTSCAETSFINPYEDNGNRRRLPGDDEDEDQDQDENQDEQQDEQQDENQDEQADADADEDANADANGDDNAQANGDDNAAQEEAEEEEEDNDPVNEICQALTEDSFSLQDCNQDGNNNYQYDENGNAWGTYYYGSYGYITYDITDTEDDDQICMAMKKKSGYYNRVGSGSNTKLYNYNGRKSNTYSWDLYSGSSTNGYNPSGSSSSGSSSGSNGSNNGFDWQDTKQQIGDKYNTMSDKIGNGIDRASEQTGLEVEEVIGVIVGALAALCLFIACGCYCCCKKDTDEKQVNLLGEGRERREWSAKDKWATSRNKATWA
mmetsp:Transcript_27937/g.67974  ORF Transcript_27937/g.67974 Transcript_27937/m.67974 type:complete len:618 (+) Transcript_27937:26-1879(+)|eukprot:CAMPEP_0113641208 /NCGR_PEP_ID=MMETSP0017_2-20120614/21631_1 /TAXON_ID=2856 /ORGANISM="Cylindrotheca closterium" /LENGTH=617 /DNA_ID=CAMNT_0000552535 /DNA_START=26 /DNA_END=1879 /DNA_ORIENTATION=- /assembly_acc=CAM_ASM_000147